MGEKSRFGKREAVAAGVLAFALSASVGVGTLAWGSEEDVAQEKIDLRRGVMASWVAAAVGDVAEQGARSRSAEAQRMMQGYLRAKEKATKSSDAHQGGAREVAEASGSDCVKASRTEEAALSETKDGEGEQAGGKPSEPSSSVSQELDNYEGTAENAKGETAENALSPGTLLVGGAAIPYVDVRGETTPSSGGGLWLGSDAVDDGSWGYFVGHNPGSFAPVCSLSLGDVVTVCDRRGAQRAYAVRDVFQVEETATWKTIASRVTGYGESVVLQTCAGNGRNIIAVAA